MYVNINIQKLKTELGDGSKIICNLQFLILIVEVC